MKFTTKIAGVLLGTVLTTNAIAEDQRELVEFPAMMRDHMLQNMRDHLLALQEIQAFMAISEYEKAADIAENRLGMSSLDNHGASHMAKRMPKSMQAIGTGMHQAASRFAVTLQETSVDDHDLRPAMQGLADIMQQCVACHAAYRVH